MQFVVLRSQRLIYSYYSGPAKNWLSPPRAKPDRNFKFIKLSITMAIAQNLLGGC